MKMIMRYLVVLSTLLHTICAAPTSQTEVRCTAGDVIIGQRALIICYFPDDIKNHEGVYIGYHSSTDTTKEVLKCTKNQLDNSQCKGTDSFALTKRTSNTLTIEIPAVTESFAGSYVCQFVPPDLFLSKMCNLTVQGTPDNALGEERSTQSNVFLILSVVTNVFVLTAVVAFAVYKQRYKCSYFSDKKCRQDESQKGLLKTHNATDNEGPDEVLSNSKPCHGENDDAAKKDFDEIPVHSSTPGAEFGKHISKAYSYTETQVNKKKQQPEEYTSKDQPKMSLDLSPHQFSNESLESCKQKAKQYGGGQVDPRFVVKEIRKHLDILEVSPAPVNDGSINQVVLQDQLQQVYDSCIQVCSTTEKPRPEELAKLRDSAHKILTLMKDGHVDQQDNVVLEKIVEEGAAQAT